MEKLKNILVYVFVIDLIYLSSQVVALWLKYFGIIDEINMLNMLPLFAAAALFFTAKRADTILRKIEKMEREDDLVLDKSSIFIIILLLIPAVLGTFSLIKEM